MMLFNRQGQCTDAHAVVNTHARTPIFLSFCIGQGTIFSRQRGHNFDSRGWIVFSLNNLEQLRKRYRENNCFFVLFKQAMLWVGITLELLSIKLSVHTQNKGKNGSKLVKIGVIRTKLYELYSFIIHVVVLAFAYYTC